MVTIISVATIIFNFNKIIPKPPVKPVPGHIEARPLKDIPVINGDNAEMVKTKTEQNPEKKFQRPALIKMHKFDPNTISKDSLLAFGINKYAVENWQKYLAKGGKFVIKSDIKKIYNLKQEEYDKLKDYLLLPDNTDKSSFVANKNTDKKPLKQAVGRKKDIKIELNTCTAGDLKKLNGIGETLSQRIIKFRDKLGGFYSVSQLKEVWGLRPETYEMIKNQVSVDKSKIKKFKINTAGTKELALSPYLKYRQAKTIIRYRNQHGYFSNASDLYKVKVLDSALINKLLPYLDFSISQK